MMKHVDTEGNYYLRYFACVSGMALICLVKVVREKLNNGG